MQFQKGGRMRLLGAALLLFAVSVPALADSGPKTCVVSIVDSDEVNSAMIERATELLESMGYADAPRRFDFYSDPIGIRRCLEGGYEDVILISHKVEMVKGHASLLYPLRDAGGQFVRDANGALQWSILNAKIFSNIKPGPNLRQITLIACDAEKVLAEYKPLDRLAQMNNIYIRLQPSSLVAAALTFGKYRGLRAENLFAYMIAESAQDENSDVIYCLLESKLLGVYEHGRTSCLRNRFDVSYKAYVSLGFNGSIRFARVNRRHAQGLVEAQYGLIGGFHLGLSSRPVEKVTEDFGIALSILPRLTAKPIP